MPIKMPESLVGAFQELKQLWLTFSGLSLEKHRKPNSLGRVICEDPLPRGEEAELTLAPYASMETGPLQRGAT